MSKYLSDSIDDDSVKLVPTQGANYLQKENITQRDEVKDLQSLLMEYQCWNFGFNYELFSNFEFRGTLLEC
jgi:hypothetical protein